MGKKPLTPEDQNRIKPFYPQLMKYRESCFGGFLFSIDEKHTFQDTPEEREKFYHKLWDHGGFSFWLGNYKVGRFPQYSFGLEADLYRTCLSMLRLTGRRTISGKLKSS